MRRAVAAGIVVALAAVACTSDDAGGPSASDDGKVNGAEMMDWVETIVDFGVRRPGYEADDEVADWIAGEMRDAGLDDVRLEPVEVNRWTPEECTITWWRDAAPDDRSTIECFALPYSNPDVDLTAPLVADDGANDLSGHIGVLRDEFQSVPQDVIASRALEVLAPPELVANDSQPIPFGSRNGDLFSDFFGPTVARGGVGMIGVLDGLGTDQYYAPYTGRNEDLPAVWVGEEAGNVLLDALATGPATATMQVSAEREVVESNNVVGALAGSSDRWVVIGTHHDAPWASAVEDATGIAQVLAQARYWASVPAEERPHSLLFVAATGHMAGAAGTASLVADQPDLLDDTVLAVYLEHVALRAEMTEHGFEVTDEPEPRWWFVTDRPDLRALVADSLRAEALNRDLLLPAVGFFGGEAPLSDAAPLSLAGVPVVSLITTPIYLFDPRDTPDKVDVEGMEQVRAAVIRMIDATSALTTTRTLA